MVLGGNLEVSRSCGNSFQGVRRQQTPEAGNEEGKRGKIATGTPALLLRAQHGSGYGFQDPHRKALWQEASKESPNPGISRYSGKENPYFPSELFSSTIIRISIKYHYVERFCART